MPFDAALFKIIAPEFTSTSQADKDRLYIEATLRVPEDIWTGRTEHARALLVAHMLKVAQPVSTGSSGTLKRTKVGRLEREFEVGGMAPSELGRTGYGAEFLRLQKSLVKAPFIVC